MPLILNGSTGISGTDGSAATPALQGTDTNTGMFFPAADQIAFAEGGVEAMRIDASGNVGIGTTTPGARLDVSGASNTAVARIISTDSTRCDLRFQTSGSNSGLYFGNSTTFDLGRLFYDNAGNNMVFVTNSTERARITDTGGFCVNATSAILGFGSTSVGFGIEAASTDGASIFASRGTNIPVYINRNNNGVLVAFNRAGTQEGSISVSGSTVSYNGGHLARWSQLPTKQRDPALLKGTVLSNLDEMCEWFDAEGNLLLNEQLNRVKVSDVEGDPNVAGVFVNWDNDDAANTYDMNLAMTGDMIIRIAAGVVVQKGDLLMSAGDGTAKPQGDDIRRAKTVAKVTSNHVTCTYDDGSYCVPCVLMAC
jgi:hypothetical protein